MASSLKPKQDRDAYDYSGLEVVNDQAHYAPEVDLRHQPDKEAVYVDGIQETAPTPSKRRVCGMRRPIAWTVFAVVALIIVGAAVGGGVGGTQASNNKSNASPTTVPAGAASTTSTPTSASSQSSSSTSKSSSSASATPIGVGEGVYTCPESNNKNFTTTSGSGSIKFHQLCDVDWPGGVDAISGSPTSTVQDLTVVLQYSLTDCIEQCAVYSLTHSVECVAVTYGANITAAQARGLGGNCWLKNARGAVNQQDNSGQAQAAYKIGS